VFLSKGQAFRGVRLQSRIRFLEPWICDLISRPT